MSKEREIVKTSRFMLMEAADNAQIVAEINGEMLKAMVYQYKGKNRLSYAGAKFAAIQLGNIHVKESSVSYNKELDQFEASALVFNGNVNLTLPGYAEQPRFMKVWDNKEKTESHLELDEFARRKAASKAVRNALMAVMPADHIAAYMRAAIDMGKTKTIKNVEVEQKPSKEEQKARVGPPPRKTESKPKPKKEKKPQESPKSVEDVTERIASFLPGHNELVVVSEHEDYYRIGKRISLDKEIELHLDFVVSEMGGEWDNENNEWRIPRAPTRENK